MPTVVKLLRRLLPWTAGAVVGFVAGTSFADAGCYTTRRLYAASEVDKPLPPNITEGAAPSLLKESRASQIMRFGFPSYENLKTFEDFVLSYDRRNRIPYWVTEHLTPGRMVYDPSVDRSKCAFKEDKSVHQFFRSSNADYKGTGFDRGHMAAAGNHRRTQNSVDQTFLLSNMAPQVGEGFNRGKWNDLEKRVRRLARQNVNVYVCTGPLYLPRANATDQRLYVTYRVIGQHHIAVPTHFFKVILMESSANKFAMEAYVLPNESIADTTPLDRFLVPPDSIERAAGFLIFDKLNRKLLATVKGKSPSDHSRQRLILYR